MEIFLHAHTWIALLTLVFLEVILGIDNIIFISLVSAKLPEDQQAKARNIGLVMALVMRVLLLMGISYIVHLTNPLFTIDFMNFNHEVSVRDLILLVGGAFLLAKSTTEIHHKIEGESGEETSSSASKAMGKVILQIVMLDVIFSFDSILTAVGLSDELLLMVIAVVISIIIMMVYAGRISAFINNYPTLQILALSFLILIGFMLVLDAFHYEIPKGYIYFSVFFSLTVEMVNIRIRNKRKAKKSEAGA
jgi:predicted tellurium resistance membrane protein TerC